MAYIFTPCILCLASFRHAQTSRGGCLYPSRWIQVHPQEQESHPHEEPAQPEAQRGDASSGRQEHDGQPRPWEHYHICSHRAKYGKESGRRNNLLQFLFVDNYDTVLSFYIKYHNLNIISKYHIFTVIVSSDWHIKFIWILFILLYMW